MKSTKELAKPLILTPYHLGALLCGIICYFGLKYIGMFRGIALISPETISSVGLIGILSYGIFGNDKHVDIDKLKFSGLLLWNVFAISFITEILGMIWSIVFVMGFVNTLGIACGLLILHAYGWLMPLVAIICSVYDYIKSYISNVFLGSVRARALLNNKVNDHLTSTFEFAYKWFTYLNTNYFTPLGESYIWSITITFILSFIKILAQLK